MNEEIKLTTGDISIKDLNAFISMKRVTKGIEKLKINLKDIADKNLSKKELIFLKDEISKLTEHISDDSDTDDSDAPLESIFSNSKKFVESNREKEEILIKLGLFDKINKIEYDDSINFLDDYDKEIHEYIKDLENYIFLNNLKLGYKNFDKYVDHHNKLKIRNEIDNKIMSEFDTEDLEDLEQELELMKTSTMFQEGIAMIFKHIYDLTIPVKNNYDKLQEEIQNMINELKIKLYESSKEQKNLILQEFKNTLDIYIEKHIKSCYHLNFINYFVIEYEDFPNEEN